MKIPKTGYVGGSIVDKPVQSVKDFTLTTPTGERPTLEILQYAPAYLLTAHDPELAEYFVRVKWLDKVSTKDTLSEMGLFGNQNTVCQPSTPKWRDSVERLKTFFSNWVGKETSL